MDLLLPSCPHLPPPRVRMDWRDVRSHGADRGPAFYLTVLEYSHYLWQRGRAARAVLCLDRAFGADLPQGDGEPRWKGWPPPYEALAWFLAHTPPEIFLGNPRIHFQHLADRMNEPRRDQRRWRAWACWAITRRVLPHLPGDPRRHAREPEETEIGGQLAIHGQAAEGALWQRVLQECGPRAPSSIR